MPTLTTLVSFNGTNGQYPQAGLIEDSAGDLFGTTYNGGASNDGTVFEIVNTATGYATAPTTLVNFNLTDGAKPFGTLLMDAAGDLFGTTTYGAAGAAGSVYEIAKTATGYAGTPTTLVSFTAETGDEPQAGLIADAAGDLFGTTSAAGPSSGTAPSTGTVFEIAKTASGFASTPTILANFTDPGGISVNGMDPIGNLVMDAAGDLFGTTSFGATNNAGAVFEIAKTSSGYAPITTLADLTTAGISKGGLAIDAAGDLFGTTDNGGPSNEGTVFEIARTATGYASTPTILASFNLMDGQSPVGGLIIDGAGNLWGTTIGGEGSGNAGGEVFEIAKTATGYASTPTIVVGFGSSINSAPTATLFANAAGDLFGTSSDGGATPYDDGTVFEVTGSGFVTGSTPATGLAIQDTTTGRPISATARPYTGPVSGLTSEYITAATDSLNISVSTPNWFIHSGSGNDAIAVSGGTNVLDGSTGSNFLTGGTGEDTFFVDDRGPASAIWDTVNNFHSGDAATIWGVTPSDFTLSWVDGQGAAGYTGLTLHATAAGAPTASLTLAGFTSADLTNGKLTVTYGTTVASGGVPASNYMYVHAN
jgi:uncharacterized repeat protein (TIGR03803 family)